MRRRPIARRLPLRPDENPRVRYQIAYRRCDSCGAVRRSYGGLLDYEAVLVALPDPDCRREGCLIHPWLHVAIAAVGPTYVPCEDVWSWRYAVAPWAVVASYDLVLRLADLSECPFWHLPWCAAGRA